VAVAGFFGSSFAKAVPVAASSAMAAAAMSFFMVSPVSVILGGRTRGNSRRFPAPALA